MHQLKIDPFLLIRSPAYSYEDFNARYLQQVLQTDFFRASLFFASQAFYTELQKKGFRYEELSPGAKLTLWKYLNRMCHRALPYGFFSSYSPGTWAEEGGESLCFSDEDELIVHPDFKLVLDEVSGLNTDDFDALRFYTNNSLYPSSKELRFISQGYAAEKKKFAIVQLKITPGLNKLLKFISKGRTKAEIISFLEGEYGEEAPLEDYFKGLLSGQVVVSALTPNVTGQLFHERCLELLGTYPGIDTRRLSSFRLPISRSETPDLSPLNDHISYLAGKNEENPSYSLYRRSVQGGLNGQVQERLVTLIRNMDKLTADHHIDTMEKFKEDFVRKYDQQEVPLMIVLDPGSGIGYENMASAFDAQNEDFIDDLREKKESKAGARWGAVEKMIFKKWSNLKKEGADRIMISSDDLLELPESGQQLPPGMFVLFKSIDNELWADTIGGVSGIELSARFSPSGTDMETSLKKICEQEMALNRDFVFAEIAWSPNDRTSNVNQRGHYYAYEIPVLTHAVRPEEFTIRLSDLMVSLRNNQVYLRSVKLDRYIIPRLSSAYNYKISAIPVFRFLCDLQYQGIKSNLSLSLSNLFPGMEYYPRLQVEDAVLSPATWVLNEDHLKKITAEDVFPVMDVNIPGHFCLLEGDNFLVFNREDENDLDLFRMCVRNKKTVTLTEYAFAGSPVLKDSRGKPFAGQFLACVINQRAVYQLPLQQSARPLKEDAKVKRSFLPGEEWLYIKLYAHYSLTDEILLSFIMPVVKKHKKDNPDFKWFFIRYLDPGFHLRLRFFTGEKPSHELLSDLMRKLQPWTRAGKVSDVVLDSYQRELEKYSVSLIAEAESFFYRDTEFILAVFSANELNTNFKLAFAVNSSLQIIRGFIADKKERSEFLNEALNNLSAEFSRDKEVVRKLDVRYRKFQKQIVENQQSLALQKKKKADVDFKRMTQLLVAQIEGWDNTTRYNLLINLVHLHINRIFENTPREYEYLIYHFMKKHQSFLNYTTSDGS